MEIKNDSGRNLVVSLGAQAPRNFETSFTEQYGSQELSSIPIDAGQSKTVKLKVRPPSTTGANRYPVSVKASAEDASADTSVALEITGQPQLNIAGRDGVLSGRAEAGKETTIPIVVTNNGTAPADEVALSSSAPSGWKIEFEPKTLDAIAPGTQQGSPGAGDAAGEGDRRRLLCRPSPPRRAAKQLRPSSASRFRPRRYGASPASASSASRC